MSAKAVMGIVAALIVSGITAIVGVTYSDARAAGQTEVRVHAIEKRLDDHDVGLSKASRLLERIDERLERFELDMGRRLERVENKQDEALRRKGK